MNIHSDFLKVLTDGQGWQYSMLVRYGTPRFLPRSTVRLFCNGTGTVRFFL